MGTYQEIKTLLFTTFKALHNAAFANIPINWPNYSVVDLESLANPFVSVQLVFKSNLEMFDVGNSGDIVRGEMLVSYLCPANTGLPGSSAYSDMLRSQFCFKNIGGVSFRGLQILEVSPAPGIVGQMNVIPFMV